MVEALLIGLKSKVDATSGDPAAHNSFYTVIGGRWYDNEAPGKEPTFPYATVNTGQVLSRYAFDHIVYTVPVQIDLYSNKYDSSEIDDIFDAFKTLFFPTKSTSWIDITVTGFTQVMFKPDNFIRFKLDNIWQITFEFVWEGQES
jgi:hypothetical protein